MRFNFVVPLTQFFGLLLKTFLILFLFGTVNIYKAVSSDITVLLPCILQPRSHFEGFVMLSTLFEVSTCEAYLINI